LLLGLLPYLRNVIRLVVRRQASEAGPGPLARQDPLWAAPAMTSNMMHASPATVLSHNPVIADKVKTLTGEDAATACSGFKNIGECVAAGHVARNLSIPGGFDALKAKMTGTGSVNLGKAILQLAPAADAKSESKKANMQAEQDLNQPNS